MTMRADVALTARGLAESRERAQALITAGIAYKGEKCIQKPSERIAEEDNLTIRGERESLASRGAHKLEKAIADFRADVRGLICMDIGAAAGGFTDILLKNGAEHVYAIDVGSNQLDSRLRADARVTVMERQNARFLTEDMLTDGQPRLTVMDVSFISIKLLLPVAARLMGEHGRFITLVKPQFEAGKGQVGKNGVVRDGETHARVLREIRDFAQQMGWSVRALTYSPITGPKGNIEFLADIQPGVREPLTDKAVLAVVREAHQAHGAPM